MSYGLRIRRMPPDEITHARAARREDPRARPVPASASRASSPAGSASAWPWDAPSCASPRRSSSTSRSPTWMRSCACRCAWRSRSCTANLKTTSIFVTHDQVEAMTLADRMIVMNAGVVEQIGRPIDVYDDPDIALRGGLHRLARHELPAGQARGRRRSTWASGVRVPLPAELRAKARRGDHGRRAPRALRRAARRRAAVHASRSRRSRPWAPIRWCTATFGRRHARRARRWPCHARRSARRLAFHAMPGQALLLRHRLGQAPARHDARCAAPRGAEPQLLGATGTVALRRLAPALAARQGQARAPRERGLPVDAAAGREDRVLRAPLRRRRGLPALFRITPFSQPAGSRSRARAARLRALRCDGGRDRADRCERCPTAPSAQPDATLARGCEAVGELRGSLARASRCPPRAPRRACRSRCAPWRSMQGGRDRRHGARRSSRTIARASSTSSRTRGARRQGHGARIVVARCSRSALRDGARHAYLQVRAGQHAGARALSRSSASSERYLYWYRGRDGRAPMNDDRITALARAPGRACCKRKAAWWRRRIVHRRRRGRSDHAHPRQLGLVRPRLRHLHRTTAKEELLGVSKQHARAPMGR